MNRIALVQMTSSQNVAANLSFAAEAITQAAQENAGMVFLPESFACLGSEDIGSVGRKEISSQGPIREFLSSMARENKLWIVAGTLPIASRPDGTEVPGNRVRAACFVYNDLGQEVARYDKMHMFDVSVDDGIRHYAESDTFEAGDQLVTVQTPVGLLGLSVCYDIRFPEMYRALLHKGVDIIAIPAAFTRVTGEAHWNVLVRARAIENGCYIVAPCQWGKHGSNRETWGESLVVDPWGQVISEMKQGAGVISVDLETNLVSETRAKMPVREQTKLNISWPPQRS